MPLKKRRYPFQNTSIRYTIFIYFTVSALAASIFIGLSMYSRMSGQMSAAIQEENQILINQLSRTTDTYLRTIIKLSDSLYYGAVKNADLSDSSINREITLLYDNNKDNVENIALLSNDGRLLEAVPAARLKTNLDVPSEPWFRTPWKRRRTCISPSPRSSTSSTPTRTSTAGSFPFPGQWRSPRGLPRTRGSCSSISDTTAWSSFLTG